MIPYFIMAILYLSMAFLMALDVALVDWQILPWFNGTVWLRVHFITLGVLTEVTFAVMPALVAIYYRLPRPKFHWDIWLLLNAGILTLLIGMPLVNRLLIFTGGTLIFAAASLLLIQLVQLRSQDQSRKATESSHAGRKFYIAGLSYFLLGIIVGTGIFLGWSEPLFINTPVEVHIHANNWGLMSLVFAGLIVDLYPVWAKRPLASPKSITPIFWMMTLGAFGLIFGPWFANTYLLVPGLLLHLAATIWLLFNVIKPLWGDREAWTLGMWHIVLSYFWLLAPILMAPLVLFKIAGIPTSTIEGNAPQALIYGWLLQFAFAVVPYFFMRLFFPGEPARLGGTRFSLLAVNLGGAFLWAGIFIAPLQATLYGIAYLLWALSMLPILAELWRITRSGINRLERDAESIPVVTNTEKANITDQVPHSV